LIPAPPPGRGGGEEVGIRQNKPLGGGGGISDETYDDGG
jgi:hypothetical protein